MQCGERLIFDPSYSDGNFSYIQVSKLCYFYAHKDDSFLKSAHPHNKMQTNSIGTTEWEAPH